jgi:hypothetical protein
MVSRAREATAREPYSSPRILMANRISDVVTICVTIVERG